MRTRLLAALCLLPFATAVPGQVASGTHPAAHKVSAFSAEEAAEVVAALADGLEENFVFPEVGKAYAAALRANLDKRSYDQFETREQFAEAVTADLQALHKDGHLRLFAPAIPGAKSKYRTAPGAEGAIGRSGWLAGGVAYIQFTMFPGDPSTLDSIKSFLDNHSTARVLIIDVRTHHGGDVKEADLIGSYLFSKEALFAHMDTRASVDSAGGGPFEDSPTMRRISGPDGIVRRAHLVSPGPATPLREAKVFLLTSKKSASAAEAFALGLKRTERAVLIGETTRGAGHFGNQYPMPHGYSAFIPVGRTFDPSTGEGWEGIGVKPDIAVPAEEALDEALRMAGVQLSGEIALTQLK